MLSALPNWLKLGFPRDGTPCCPFVLGKKNPCRGQTPLYYDVPGQNHFLKRNQKTGKGRSKTQKDILKPKKIRSKTGKDVLKHE